MMNWIQNGDITLHICDEGPRDGRVVMFANSLGTDLRLWAPLIAHLPSGLRLVRYDKRGHGLTSCPPAPYTMDSLVDDAEAVAGALRLSDITFIGLSIGGLIGQGLAARRPDLLRALVLMDTAAKIGDDAMWDTRMEMVRKDGLPAIADAIMPRWFARDTLDQHPEVVGLARTMLSQVPSDGYLGCCAAIKGADFRQTTPSVTLRVMAMAGEEDGSTPPDLVRATADLCNGAFHEIPGAGHLPCYEKPAETAALISAFLKETA